MAERATPPEPNVGAWTRAGGDSDLALLVLHSRRRDPCAERVARELERRRTPAELAAITENQAQTLLRIINAVLDGIGLTDEQRERAIEILVTELNGVADEDAR